MAGTALLIEDDDHIVELLKEPLAELGVEIAHAADGKTGLERALSEKFSFILLDLMLPEVEGAEICKQIRQQDNGVPIIVLSAITDELNTALLLELGADDYIAKPFRKLELKARIKSVLRRVNPPTESSEQIEIGELKIDNTRRIVTISDKVVELTAREFDLLTLLASHPGRPFTRDQLNEHLYGYEAGVYDHSISCHVNRIRSKIEPDTQKPTYLLTKRGVGYYFTSSLSQ